MRGKLADYLFTTILNMNIINIIIDKISRFACKYDVFSFKSLLN